MKKPPPPAPINLPPIAPADAPLHSVRPGARRSSCWRAFSCVASARATAPEVVGVALDQQIVHVVAEGLDAMHALDRSAVVGGPRARPCSLSTIFAGRSVPVYMMSRLFCSSSSTSSFTGTGSTCTLPSVSMVSAVTLPKAAMYWSCLPTGSAKRSISMWQASSAKRADDTKLRLYVYSALSRATVKLLEEPSPAVRRQVRHAGQLDAALDARHAQRLTEDGMPNRGHVMRQLGLGVSEPNAVVKTAVRGPRTRSDRWRR